MKVIESRQNRPEVNPTYAAQTRAQIQQLLGLPSADGFTIIQWNPTVVRPAEASYVILKQRIAELGNFFAEASYEDGRFWNLAPHLTQPIEEAEILGWSYPPFAERLTLLGSCAEYPAAPAFAGAFVYQGKVSTNQAFFVENLRLLIYRKDGWVCRTI